MWPKRFRTLPPTHHTWLPAILAQVRSSVNQFWSTRKCIRHQGVSTPRWWIHMVSCGYEYSKNSKSFPCVLNGTIRSFIWWKKAEMENLTIQPLQRRSCVMQKTRVKKSCAAVPSRCVIAFFMSAQYSAIMLGVCYISEQGADQNSGYTPLMYVWCT